MSTGALVMMIVVMTVVWGGAGLALYLTWRQERRQGEPGREDSDVDPPLT